MHYRVAEWAGTGKLHPDEAEQLELKLTDIYWSLHFGTVDAVFNEDYLEYEEEAHNTYSDGRSVMVESRIEPAEESEPNFEHPYYMYDDGAMIFHSRGTICNVSPIHAGDEWGWVGVSF